MNARMLSGISIHSPHARETIHARAADLAAQFQSTPLMRGETRGECSMG